MERLYAPWRMAYIDGSEPKTLSDQPSTGCVFCDKAQQTNDDQNLVVFRGLHCFVLLNLYPYNNGHLLVVPYLHTAKLIDLDSETSSELMQLAQKANRALDATYHPDGYNFGMNLGVAAGAGIAAHLHLHLVPRWSGDTNFMTVLGDVKVLPDLLENSCRKIRAAWVSLEEEASATEKE